MGLASSIVDADESSAEAAVCCSAHCYEVQRGPEQSGLRKGKEDGRDPSTRSHGSNKFNHRTPAFHRRRSESDIGKYLALVGRFTMRPV